MMNEKIKELYEQAHIEHRQEYVSSTMKSVSVTRQFDPDLFAELIIRECMDIVDKVYDEQTGMLVKMCRRATPYQEIINEIEEHFGVE